MRASRLTFAPRLSPSLLATSALLLLAVTVLLVLSPPAEARRDRTPPKFAGLESAITCIPGPIGGDRTSSYHLQWRPAWDRVTPRWAIVYDIYQATKPGGEDFSVPTYTTRRGARSFDTPQLPSSESFYFVVRARDAAGNRDSNTVERHGENLCV